MQLKVILNRVEPIKSFVYKKIEWDESSNGFLIRIEPRRNSRPVCSGCRQRGGTYDHQAQSRHFEYVPLWGMRVFFVYRMRRVNCRSCGVKVERVPWARGKHHLTTTYSWFLARWAKRLSWTDVAETFQTSWEKVYRSVELAVQWGLFHRETSGITSIGVDEIQWKKGHRYLTLVYQIDSGCRRLLWIGQDRREATLHRFFDLLGSPLKKTLKSVCSDMWTPYLNVLATRVPDAIHVLDRFHVMKMLNKAIDEIRASETRRLKSDGYEPILKHSRWCLLKRKENLTKKQTVKLSELMEYNLKAVRAYLLREDFQQFWEYSTAGWAGRFLKDWCKRTIRSKLEPMKKVARTLRKHHDLLTNWFRAKGQISAGIVEGFNNKAKLTTRKAYGFRTLKAAQVALYHSLGDLPEPKITHRFC
jgi:transposase